MPCPAMLRGTLFMPVVATACCCYCLLASEYVCSSPPCPHTLQPHHPPSVPSLAAHTDRCLLFPHTPASSLLPDSCFSDPSSKAPPVIPVCDIALQCSHLSLVGLLPSSCTSGILSTCVSLCTCSVSEATCPPGPR